MILVDDGSTDNSATMVDEIAQTDNRISVIHQCNQGLSAARNTGIKAAKGRYITFIDSDDFIAQDTYKGVMELLNAHPEYDILEFSVIEKYGSKTQHPLILDDCVYQNQQEYWLKGQAYRHTYAWNKIYRRELFADIEFPKGRNFEDAHTLPKLMAAAKTIATTSLGTYYYCWNDAGITANANGQDLTSLLEAHLAYINGNNEIDATYYAHVLNIQLDVYEATKAVPLLPIRPFYGNLKLTLLHLLGIKCLCKLNTLFHKTIKPSH
jgi:glycosyltransferase, group 2 family protein